MSDLIMQLAGVIQRDIDGLKDVAQNVANANTPGYRSSRAFSLYSPAAGGSGVEQGLDSIYMGSSLNTQGGALQHSGRTTDLALSGDAWFGLQTPDGAMLTRDGRFHVDSAGYLVSAAGYPVMGEEGPIQVSGGLLEIDSQGKVQVEGQFVGQLSLFRVDNPEAMARHGDGLYSSVSPLLVAKDVVLHQGMLERSNAAMGDEMVRMMAVSRHVESMQRALSAYDGMLDSGINQLGKD